MDLKSVITVTLLVFVLGLCTFGVVNDKMAIEAALATGLASLTSVGVLLPKSEPKKEEPKPE